MFARPDHPDLCAFHHKMLHPPTGFFPPPPEGRPFSDAELESQLSDFPTDLLGPMQDFSTRASINRALSKLANLLAGNRISPRRAAVLAYTFQLLLQTLPDDREDVTGSPMASVPAGSGSAQGTHSRD
jgi:hypothetical protein